MSTRPERVLSFPDALAVVLEHAALLQSSAVERVALADADGRILAGPITAERDQPPFDRSTRDGYAVHTADLPGPLQLAGSLRAGERPADSPLERGHALEIMTGAPVPPGADAVLMVEHAVLSKNAITLAGNRTLRPGGNIVPRAAEARAGTELVPAGRRVAAPEIALAASCGLAELSVYRRPTAAIIATGDELVELDEQPEPWQIRNSNTHALSALVREAGGIPLPLPHARDTAGEIDARLQDASDANLLLLSGGVSMGKYDLVEEALAKRGAEFLFTGVLIQPGKPLVFGRLPRTGELRGARPELGAWQYFFGLPGNPVSTEVCFRLFAGPLLRALAGDTALPPRFVEAKLAHDVRGGAKVTRFLPAELAGDWQSVAVRLVPWHGSGDLAANARAHCFAVLPAETPAFTTGETIRILLR